MSVCTFFGHSQCYGLDKSLLQRAIEDMIARGADTFYVGNHGDFDNAILYCLQKLKKHFPHIRFSVVLAYMPTHRPEYDLYADCSIFPEGLEFAPPKFAIERRNNWMIAQADFCLCYVDHTWGGAYKAARRAKNRGLQMINLGNAVI